MDRPRDSHYRQPDALPTAGRQSYTTEAVLKTGWRRKWQIVLPAIVIAAAASWWIHRLPDRYRSDAVLMFVPQPIPETFVRSTVTSRGDNRLQSITQQILSRTRLEPIIREFDLYAERRETTPMQDIVERMRTGDIEIRAVKGDAFRLGFISENPEVAKQVVERLVSLFITETSSIERPSPKAPTSSSRRSSMPRAASWRRTRRNSPSTATATTASFRRNSRRTRGPCRTPSCSCRCWSIR